MEAIFFLIWSFITFPGATWGLTKKLGPIGSAVRTFIWYKQTDKKNISKIVKDVVQGGVQDVIHDWIKEGIQAAVQYGVKESYLFTLVFLPRCIYLPMDPRTTRSILLSFSASWCGLSEVQNCKIIVILKSTFFFSQLVKICFQFKIFSSGLKS